MMNKRLRNVFKSVIMFAALSVFSTASMANEFDPYDDIIHLLEARTGTISGTHHATGYYVIAIGFSGHSSENKGREAARMDAHRKISEMVNGVVASGSSGASSEYVTVSNSETTQDFSREEYFNVINMSFSGSLTSIKEIKTGKYNGEHYVALMLAETDVNNSHKLARSSNSMSNGGDMTIIVTGGTGDSIAKNELTEKIVESKGYGSLKLGKTKARKLALEDALNNAVQQAQGVMLQGKSGKFNEAISLAISMKSEGYITSYEILTDDVIQGEVVVEISAVVNSGKLLNDVSFYTNILGNPVFNISSENEAKKRWLGDELERLGFAINEGSDKTTHTFYLEQTQTQVEDHKGAKGTETSVNVVLKDNYSNDILFTVTNNPIKTRIYVKPESRAKQVSEHAAYKQLQKKMGAEIIQSLAKRAEKGTVYRIVLKNSNRNDVALFKHVLNNGTSGNVETWHWDKKGKTMILEYRFSGPLSEALDQSLDELYASFKKEGKGRRPHAIEINNRGAEFNIIKS